MGLPKFALVEFFADETPGMSIIESTLIERHEGLNEYELVGDRFLHECAVHDGNDCTCENFETPTVIVLIETGSTKKNRTIHRHPAKVLQFSDERDTLETAQKAFENGCEVTDGKRLRVPNKRFLDVDDGNGKEANEALPSKVIKKRKKAEDNKVAQKLKESLLDRMNTEKSKGKREKEQNATASQPSHQSRGGKKGTRSGFNAKKSDDGKGKEKERQLSASEKMAQFEALQVQNQSDKQGSNANGRGDDRMSVLNRQMKNQSDKQGSNDRMSVLNRQMKENGDVGEESNDGLSARHSRAVFTPRAF